MVRLVVLGGSGASTPELIDALAAWPGGSERRPDLSVTLVGRSHEKLELVGSACRSRAPKHQPSITIETSLNRRAALSGADIVLNQVRVGGLSARVFDETLPRAHGLPGEETMGPGGFANALRTLPALTDTWEDVAAVAPSALVVNLTNPSGIVSHAALDQVAIRLVSICDSPTTLCERIGERLGVPAATIRRGYLGMNHVGWWTPSSPDELTAAASIVEGLTSDHTAALGAISGPYVRYYLRPQTILAQQSESRAVALQDLEATLLESYASGSTTVDSPRRGAVWYERAFVPLLDGWLNGHADPLILGLRNGRSVPWLPKTAIVEMAVDVSVRGRLVPLPAPELPDLPAAMLSAHSMFEALTAIAATSEPTPVARRRALAANPMVRDLDLADALCRDIEHASSA